MTILTASSKLLVALLLLLLLLLSSAVLLFIPKVFCLFLFLRVFLFFPNVFICIKEGCGRDGQTDRQTDSCTVSIRSRETDASWTETWETLNKATCWTVGYYTEGGHFHGPVSFSLPVQFKPADPKKANIQLFPVMSSLLTRRHDRPQTESASTLTVVSGRRKGDSAVCQVFHCGLKSKTTWRHWTDNRQLSVEVITAAQHETRQTARTRSLNVSS